MRRSADELGLDALVEAHDADELERAVGLGADPIGINARDLATFRIDRRRAARPRRAGAARPGRRRRERHRLARPGRRGRARRRGRDPRRLGADAGAPTPPRSSRELLSRPLVKVCGLTREEDVAVAAEAGADLAGFILAEESPRRAERVLPVPETMLSVAVLVGEPARTRRRPRPALRRGRTATGPGRRALARAARRSPGYSTCPGRRPIPTTSSGRRARAGRVVLAGGLGPENVRRRDRDASSPWAVDASSRARVAPGDQGSRRACGAFVEAVAVTTGLYGPYGGRYVPETLIPALDELEAGLARGPRRRGVPRRARPAAAVLTAAARRR